MLIRIADTVDKFALTEMDINLIYSGTFLLAADGEQVFILRRIWIQSCLIYYVLKCLNFLFSCFPSFMFLHIFDILFVNI